MRFLYLKPSSTTTSRAAVCETWREGGGSVQCIIAARYLNSSRRERDIRGAGQRAMASSRRRSSRGDASGAATRTHLGSSVRVRDLRRRGVEQRPAIDRGTFGRWRVFWQGANQKTGRRWRARRVRREENAAGSGAHLRLSSSFGIVRARATRVALARRGQCRDRSRPDFKTNSSQQVSAEPAHVVARRADEKNLERKSDRNQNNFIGIQVKRPR